MAKRASAVAPALVRLIWLSPVLLAFEEAPLDLFVH